jgi:H+/Cl- antiporter ClcA/CBS domain-containing protein
VTSARSTNRIAVLSLLAALIGLVAGGAAYVLVHLIGLLTNLALFHRWDWDLPSMAALDPGPGLYVAAIGGAFLVALLARWAPIIKGHGIPEAMEAVLTKQSRIAPRTAVAKPLSAAVAIGSASPFGAEGPIIVTGGAIGSLVGQFTHVSPNERKILLASGAAAGMAATFGSPLAAVVLAIELLLFEFSTRAFIPLVVATSIAGGVHSAVFGSGPLFSVPPHEFAGLGELPFYAPLGLLCGVLAVVVSKGLFVVEDAYRRLPVSPFWHPVIGAIGFATVGMFEPRALGVGYDAIEDVLDGRLALATVAALAIAKLLAWWLALGSGTSGGTLAPLLLISACVGYAVGDVASRGLGLDVSPGAFALVAMAATFGAATRATFASIVFVFELTRDYDAILPLMLATVLADLTARHLLADSLMTEKLTRRGLRVPSDFHADVMRTIDVRDVMTRDVVTMPSHLTVADAVDHFREGHHSAYPVVDGAGLCIGILSRGDLLHNELDDSALLSEVAGDKEVISAVPSEPVIVALERMLDEGVEHLPVLGPDRRIVGICTRTDVLSARQRHFALDRRQTGWLRALS